MADEPLGLEALLLPMTWEETEAQWVKYRAMGPCHETVYRLTRLRGWTIDPDALDRFLAPEIPTVTYYGRA